MAEAVLFAARLEDVAALVELLEAADLPTAGLADNFPAGYVVAWQGETLVGAAGLEVYENVGLLRSVVVAPSQQGTGLGRALVSDRLAAAATANLERVYLLTTTAATYFRRLGFEDTPRPTSPVALLLSPEFAGVCPALATCLVLDLKKFASFS